MHVRWKVRRFASRLDQASVQLSYARRAQESFEYQSVLLTLTCVKASSSPAPACRRGGGKGGGRGGGLEAAFEV